MPSLKDLLHRILPRLSKPTSSPSPSTSTSATDKDTDDRPRTTLHGTAADATTQIWLLDTTASADQADPNTWTADLVAAFFASRTGTDLADAVSDISARLGLADSAAQRATVEQRARPFFAAVLGGRGARVAVGHGAPQPLVPSDEGGVSRTRVVLRGARRDGAVERAEVVDAPAGVDVLTAHVTFAAAEGWAVISDIDDTIKRTLTDSPTGILETTFAQPGEPIRGQPEFYAHMARALRDPPFWYLSASPYNLYPFLHDFRDTHYPPGTILLRNTSWQNVASFLASLTKGTQAYKVAKMDGIYERFPRRRMVCIGDSTQSDPEAYAEMYRKHPDWIKKIFIRKAEMVAEVTDILPGQGNEERNATSRFEKAFEGVPRDVWYVFSEPKELYKQIDDLVAT